MVVARLGPREMSDFESAKWAEADIDSGCPHLLRFYEDTASVNGRSIFRLQSLRRNVKAAGEHQLNGVEHDVTSRRLWDVTESAQAESALDFVLIVRSRQNDDRNGRVTLTQFAKDGEAVAIG